MQNPQKSLLPIGGTFAEPSALFMPKVSPVRNSIRVFGFE
jgi:hypothetical protein